MNIIRLIQISLILTFFVILMGAYTRLADAGLGCPDWPGCYGHISVPTSEKALSKASQLYPESVVEPYKAWLEMIHRYLAGTLGMIVFAISYFTLKARHGGRVIPVSLSLLVVFQAALGAWTVTLKLMPVIVMLHLIGGFTLFSLLFLLYARLKQEIGYERNEVAHFMVSDGHPSSVTSKHAPVQVTNPALKLYAAVALIVVVVQILLGGWTSSNYAALMCTSLPICDGNWTSYLNFAQAFDFRQAGHTNYEFGVLDYSARMTIHVSHRIGAFVTTIVLVGLAHQLFQQSHIQLRKGAYSLMVLLSLQLMLGISNVVFNLPLPVAVAHNLGAALLLLCTVYINFHVWRSVSEPLVAQERRL
ncbi:putative Cytochrome oxidase assembly protein (COX15-CtaA) [Vibrio nigripulchritudo SO65]|uniref:COX15/CtaA family protein n=1 Tax=Vibrio nigripulchritudo TaxID=28173 RepID=UPI0003B224F8|nr:COX15/CtaA family protein [Vibrio nigripulchritudo]CCN35259.1 putative Cytochrome oxidase assembly protein (COX15-CtaA) [Vibrio nigripulchritudo AM115]CCN40325.1 putative Cytochrome oxidase assembly protein (COX15-CtaA) [Vibrio nigripulchritudo FTn2]CCN63240.1 putative Cytochrome oxidase assembly protein (COX15-CtaA) [Vibrio nigripulchritudo POn4]CCN76937.1 putative Cytochrome oxidase assembly protein (COX15-CtaA) [Vibrio nigripulchritudo SO65]